ncbi:MAG TPA: DUF3060 domain-containing protein [Kofleriaceae bacterium]|nr:DUF3060 domain-containing protein [Kofleriaceae bacterium]
MRHLIFALPILLASLPATADKTITSNKTAAWDCAKDPTVHIMHGNGSYRFKGSCKSIIVQGGNNQVVVEAVEQLQILGGNNTIEVGALDTASIVGADNKLTWRKAMSGDQPKVSTVGAGNQIAQAK